MPQTTNNGYMPDQKMSGGQNHGYQSSPSYIETKDNKITEKLRKMVPKAIRKRFQREDKTAWGKVKKAGRVVKRAVVEGAKYIKKAVQRAAKAVKHKINTGRWKPSRVLSDYE
ncbi:alpha beta hydrolase, putative [Babesia ovis]|uniref:Alpha beta hydrolase, putative n=1 Tax=Babesia ovis TaxID=5869 RepID=A0A9W5WUD0_BABOV|nr:alpha beta hydrolase, putative [Babesia ovis]